MLFIVIFILGCIVLLPFSQDGRKILFDVVSFIVGVGIVLVIGVAVLAGLIFWLAP